MAPCFANLFMALIETKFIYKSTFKPLFYAHFIDDIFLVWTHGRPALENLRHEANSTHPSINFTVGISAEKVPFLDVMLNSITMSYFIRSKLDATPPLLCVLYCSKCPEAIYVGPNRFLTQRLFRYSRPHPYNFPDKQSFRGKLLFYDLVCLYRSLSCTVKATLEYIQRYSFFIHVPFSE
ncbi:hypothetical protein HOLleu_34889 [Holothuria leucospilota]|uniref:Reverse transcriptase domain-containing protein n=1 Tax=Holothuria leucospilota TaxID=206669 RepID=A0A9Q0YSM2_HOLLE|nr:hypothetical protein HOLleu_34889 [Holothuria leucospilota]